MILSENYLNRIADKFDVSPQEFVYIDAYHIKHKSGVTIERDHCISGSYSTQYQDNSTIKIDSIRYKVDTIFRSAMNSCFDYCEKAKDDKALKKSYDRLYSTKLWSKWW